MKKILIPVVIILFLAFTVYFYTQHKKIKVVAVNSNNATTSTGAILPDPVGNVAEEKTPATTTNEVVEEKYIDMSQFNKISGGFLSTERKYDDLNTYEKLLVDTYLMKNPEIERGLKFDFEDRYKDNVRVNYYDKKNIIFSLYGWKGIHIYMVGSDTFTKSNDQKILIAPGAIQNKNYIVTLGLGGLVYLKPGMKEFELIKNSQLNYNIESYAASTGPGGEDIAVSFNEKTNTLTAGVFKTTDNNNGAYPKLRDVKFVLP